MIEVSGSDEIWCIFSSEQICSDEKVKAYKCIQKAYEKHTNAYKKHTKVYKLISSNQLDQDRADPALSQPWRRGFGRIYKTYSYRVYIFKSY